jgi:archaellum component FlaC
VFGRRAKKETAELKEKYTDLEGKYEHLSVEHDKLKEEAGEKTTMRISAIEEGIDSMNTRVEKLATDSYEIHSELRDLKDSVTEMHLSLKEIVQLYKAILNRYGTPALKEPQAKAQEARRRAAAAQAGDDPGEAVLQQLMTESKQKQRAQDATAREAPARRPPPPPQRPATAAAPPQQRPRQQPQAQLEPQQQETPPPVPPPSSIDELQRAEAEDRAEGNLSGEELAMRMAQREGGGVDRAARRDMRRPTAIRPGGEDTFLDPLPKKQVYRRAPEERPPAGGWEETASPRPRSKPRLEDVLEPE